MLTRDGMSVSIIAVVLACIAGSFITPAGVAAPAQSIPTEYADLYPALEDKLKAADAYMTPRWNRARHDVVFSAELLAANSNQGEQLFRDQAWQAVALNLDKLQTLGIRGVKVAIKSPVDGVSRLLQAPEPGTQEAQPQGSRADDGGVSGASVQRLTGCRIL
jgi:hypothetical protein